MNPPMRCASVSALIALTAPIAQAQVEPAWQFQGTLYLYLPSMGGQSAFPPSNGGSAINLDAGTILDNLKFTLMGSLEARKGPWGVFTDAIYINLGNSKSATRALNVGGVLPADVTADVDYDLKGWLWTVAGTYRAVAKPNYTLDVFAGTRMLDIDQHLRWQLGGNVGPLPLADRSGDRSSGLRNWDAIVGTKGRAAFGDGARWFIPYYIDLGAGESKFTWQAMAGVGYTFAWGDVIGAWRYVDYEMKSGSNLQNLTFSGPAVAAVFRW